MRTKKGVITSAKMTGTVTVTVHRAVYHPIYKKRFRVSKKFLADAGDFTDLMAGDLVEIAECRPLSKNKHFRITEVLERAPRVSEAVDEEAVTKTMTKEKKNEEVSEESSDSEA